MLIFGVLAVLVWRTAVEWGVSRPMAWALLAAVLYAASDELHQGYVSGRHPSVLDVGIDGCGALVGLLLVTWLSRRLTGGAVR